MIESPGQKLNRDIFLIFFNTKICCVFSLELPHRGDSNEYTQYTIFNMNKKNTLNYPKPAVMGFFSKGLKNEFETTVVNESSVFEPLKFYCKYNILERAIKTKQNNTITCVVETIKNHLRRTTLPFSLTCLLGSSQRKKNLLPKEQIPSVEKGSILKEFALL